MVSSAVQTASFERLSRVLNLLTWTCGALGCAFSLARWGLIGRVAEGDWARTLLPVQAQLAGLSTPTAFDLPARLAGLALECLPLGALLYTLLGLRGICAAYLRKEVFSPGAILGFRRMGRGLVAMALAGVVYGAGVTALVSWLASGRQGGLVAVTVGTLEVGQLLVGVMMFLLAHVMAEGRRLQAESELFV